MPESALHMSLVCRLEDFSKRCEFLGMEPLVYLDNPQSDSQNSPIHIDSFRPDLYARSRSGGFELIGEAKTATDLDTVHSTKQITAFLLWTARSSNRGFLLATQWDFVRHANSILKNMRDNLGITEANYAVLDQFGNLVSKSNEWI